LRIATIGSPGSARACLWFAVGSLVSPMAIFPPS
jgi:hypothetical protein